MLVKLTLRNIYDSRRIWKMGLMVVSVILVAGFIYMSNRIVRDLTQQERDRMEIWANATKELATIGTEQTDSMGDPMPAMQTDVDFLLSIIEGNHNIPVLLVDDQGEIMLHRNFRLPEPIDSLAPYAISDVNMSYLKKKLARLQNSSNKIEIKIDDETTQHLYYEDSTTLRQLAWFPYIQLAVMLIFLAVAYFALISVKKAEQNRVWVGLSKETAHQLGTPISSLMAWVEILKEQHPEDALIPEMDKDVKRLERIAERFSKIGSLPEPVDSSMNEVLDHVVDYMDRRTSKKVEMVCRLPDHDVIVKMNASLFEWVIENLCKNAVDAMEGSGRIVLTLTEESGRVAIEVQDNGKGIRKKDVKNVFTPGFTTKKRGWGLGLSLARRIVEEYHKGRIFVKQSEVGKGTTFRIELKK